MPDFDFDPSESAQRLYEVLTKIKQRTTQYIKDNPGTVGAGAGAALGAGVGGLLRKDWQGARTGAAGGATLGGIAGLSLGKTPGDRADELDVHDDSVVLNHPILTAAGIASLPGVAYGVRKGLEHYGYGNRSATPPVDLDRLRLLTGKPEQVELLFQKLVAAAKKVQTL
jgi:hypothetical protein